MYIDVLVQRGTENLNELKDEKLSCNLINKTQLSKYS
jgi:hypothetical protein